MNSHLYYILVIKWYIYIHFIIKISIIYKYIYYITHSLKVFLTSPHLSQWPWSRSPPLPQWSKSGVLITAEKGPV